jgi:hypothetical protein
MILLHKMEFEQFVIGYLYTLSVQEEVITLFTFSNSNVIALFHSILQHLENFVRK